MLKSIGSSALNEEERTFLRSLVRHICDRSSLRILDELVNGGKGRMCVSVLKAGCFEVQNRGGGGGGGRKADGEKGNGAKKRRKKEKGEKKAKNIRGMTPKEHDTIQPFRNIWKPLTATTTATTTATATAEAVTEAATDVPDHSYARKDSFRVYINNREGGRCAITGKMVNCHAAHVLPRAPLAVREPERSHFWALIGVLFGGALRSELWGLLGGPRCDDAGNGLYLQPTLHDGYDRLRFCLRAEGNGEGQSVISSQRPGQLTQNSPDRGFLPWGRVRSHVSCEI